MVQALAGSLAWGSGVEGGNQRRVVAEDGSLASTIRSTHHAPPRPDLLSAVSRGQLCEGVHNVCRDPLGALGSTQISQEDGRASVTPGKVYLP